MSKDPQVQDIKERVNIVELVGEFVQLTRAGQYFKARCPFHAEKSASFMVSPDRGTWHCFGCNEGGDVFTFLEKIEGLSFFEALEVLARRAGVTLSRTRRVDDGMSDEKPRLHRLLFDVAQVYHTILLQSDGAREARAYVSGRGVQDVTVRSFMIGYAPDTWDVLYKVLLKRGYDVREMVEAGVAVRSDRGGAYDRFRDRIMFPLWDHHGNVVGFTGRLLHENGTQQGKYVNTPQTKVFDKGKILYGLDRARQAIRRAGEAVIVEGQMDVIAAHQAGYEQTVASSGTALGEAQLALLKRYCSRLKMAFDMDVAGQQAALRGIGLALEQGFDVRVIRLLDGDGKDPDDCIRAHVSVWGDRVNHAQPYIAWAIDGACSEFDVSTAVGKREAARRVLPFIARIPSPIEQDHWMGELSHRLSVMPDALRLEMDSFVKLPAPRIQSVTRTVVSSRPLSRSALLLGLALATQAPVSDLALFSIRFFPAPFHPLVESLKQGYTDDSTIQLRDQLLMRVAHDYPSSTNDELVSEYRRVLAICRDRYKQQQVAMLAQHIRDAEKRGDNDRVAQLMEAYRKIAS